MTSLTRRIPAAIILLGCASSPSNSTARAVQVRPTAPVFLNNLGMALEKAGHPVAALRRYELAVQQDSTYVKAAKNVERLKEIVTDSTLTDEVDVAAIAEQFGLTVRSWQTAEPPK